MEMSVILTFCFFAFVVTMTQARSLTGDSSRFDPRESEAFKAFEAQFLQKLGLKKKPQARRDVVVPQYMLDLYNSHVKDPDYVSTNLMFKDFATTANTIRAFHPKGRDLTLSMLFILLLAVNFCSNISTFDSITAAKFALFNRIA